MIHEENPGLDVFKTPDVDDKDGWFKYAEDVSKMAEKHYQTGETVYPTLGQSIAVSSLQKYISRAKRMGRFQQLDVPEVIKQNELQVMKEQLGQLADSPDHEEIAKFREQLESMPSGTKIVQNQIFTAFANGFDTKSKYILDLLKPSRYQYRGGHLIASLLGMRPERRIWYDFIGKLTEKDEAGQPAVPDTTLVNFFEWYQSSLAKAQRKLNRESTGFVADYADCTKRAVEEHRLPQSLADNLSFFKASSPRSRNLNFSIFDAFGAAPSVAGAFVPIEIFSGDSSAPIGIRADTVMDEDQKYMVLWHELTHAITGDTIMFGENAEAARIVDEALTENISHIIWGSYEDSDVEDAEFAFMSGETYEDERLTLGSIANSGDRKIDAELFYEAYAEYDPEFDGTPEHYDGDRPQPKVGPKKQALYDALFAAYPECKTLDDLGELIVQRFGEIREA